jgi:hypothetical protein
MTLPTPMLVAVAVVDVGKWSHSIRRSLLIIGKYNRKVVKAVSTIKNLIC